MNEERKIIDSIRRLVHKPYELLSGTVVAGSVDLSKYTCSVQLTRMDDGDTPLANVMLSSVSENGNGVIYIPADGSNVIVGSVDGPGEFFLVHCSDLVKVMVTIQNTILTITADGYSITRGGESLTKILTDLMNALVQLTTQSPGGTGTLSPNSSATINNITNRIPKLLV